MDGFQFQSTPTTLPAHAPGFVMVAPSGGRLAGRSAVTLSNRAADVSEGRATALAEAARSGSGTPRITAEGFSGGTYTAVMSFDRDGEAVPSPQTRSARTTGTPGYPSTSSPSWILVVAAEIDKNGTASWGGQSSWSRSWIAPARSGSLRMVPVLGDVDDRRILTDGMLANPDSSEVGHAALALGRRFGAPAVAELLSDGQDGVRIWLWRTGGEAITGNSGSTRQDTVDVLARLAGHEGTSHSGTQEPSPDADLPVAGISGGSQVDVEQHPEFAAEGRFGFAVVLASQDAAEIASVRRAVAGLQGVEISSSLADEDGAIVSGSYAGDRQGLVEALSAAGVRVSRY